MPYVISVVGAGGKTTLINNIAKQYRSEGKKVLVSTSTHMKRENYTDISCEAVRIIACLEKNGFCMAGQILDSDEGSMQNGQISLEEDVNKNVSKIQMLPADVMTKVLPHTDIVLMEADGARHHSVKFPREHEPVVIPQTDEIIIVMGLWDIGKPVGDVIHAFAEFNNKYNVGEEELLNYSTITDKLIKEYLNKFEALKYRGKITCLFSVRREDGMAFITQKEAERLYGK